VPCRDGTRGCGALRRRRERRWWHGEWRQRRNGHAARDLHGGLQRLGHHRRRGKPRSGHATIRTSLPVAARRSRERRRRRQDHATVRMPLDGGVRRREGSRPGNGRLLMRRRERRWRRYGHAAHRGLPGVPRHRRERRKRRRRRSRRRERRRRRHVAACTAPHGRRRERSERPWCGWSAAWARLPGGGRERCGQRCGCSVVRAGSPSGGREWGCGWSDVRAGLPRGGRERCERQRWGCSAARTGLRRRGRRRRQGQAAVRRRVGRDVLVRAVGDQRSPVVGPFLRVGVAGPDVRAHDAQGRHAAARRRGGQGRRRVLRLTCERAEGRVARVLPELAKAGGERLERALSRCFDAFHGHPSLPRSFE
jgi:hypothetical protein